MAFYFGIYFCCKCGEWDGAINICGCGLEFDEFVVVGAIVVVVVVGVVVVVVVVLIGNLGIVGFSI